MSLRTGSGVKKGEVFTTPWKNDPWRKPLNITTSTTAEDFDEAQATIDLAIFGDGSYKQEIPREHTISYRMNDGTVISEIKAKSYKDASFIVDVNHKDETVDIVVTVDNRVVTTTRHRLAKIFN